jgi:hypothetical protein
MNSKISLNSESAPALKIGINPRGSDLSLIVKDKITSSLLESIKPGSVIKASLIDVSAGAGGTLNGLLDFAGKLLASVIPEDLFNEFALGKSFSGSSDFNMPVNLRLENITRSGAGNTSEISSAGQGSGGSGNFEIVFKIINETPDNQNIQKAFDSYGKLFADEVKNNFGEALKSFLSDGLNQNSGQSITASVKGNFLFVHINFGTAYGSGSLILTSDYGNNQIDDRSDKKKRLNAGKKKYVFMLETDFGNLGHIKLFSYYSDKSISVKFQECPAAAKELISSNIDVFRKMMSEDGIALSDIFFKPAAAAGTGLNVSESMNGSGSGQTDKIFSGGSIINERI